MTTSQARVDARARCVRWLVTTALCLGVASPQTVQAQARTTEWRLSPAPLFAVGRVDGVPGETFTNIVGAVRLRDGRYAVADQGEQRISVFDANGRLQRSFGRNGDGPGEFQTILGFWLTGGDTIAVWDPRSVRITRFLPDGTVTRTDRLVFAAPDNEGKPRAPDPWFGTLSDGRLVLARMTFGPRGADGLQADRMMFDLWDGHGRFQRELGEQPGMVRLRTRAGGGPHAFSPWPWAVVVRDTFVYTSGVNGELHFYSANARGRPDRTLRVAGSAIPLASAWRTLDGLIDESSAIALVKAYTRETDRSIGAVPHFGAMIADDRGRIWLKEYDPATDAIAMGKSHAGGRWRIIETDGRTVGSLRMPARVRPLSVYGDLLLGVARDELDVQTFVVYRVLN